jgi:hypothetical protein
MSETNFLTLIVYSTYRFDSYSTRMHAVYFFLYLDDASPDIVPLDEASHGRASFGRASYGISFLNKMDSTFQGHF